MKKLLYSLVLTFILLLPSGALAAGEVSLNPSSGAIDASGQSIDVIVDAQGEEIEVIEIILEYSGDLAFVGSANGDIAGCNADVNIRDSEEFDDLFIFCLMFPGTHTGSEVFVTLDFESTGTGGGSIELTSVDLGLPSVPSYQSTYTYDTTTATGGGGGPEENGDLDPAPPTQSDELPRTSTSSLSYLLIGIVLLSLPIFLNRNVSGKERKSMTEKVR